MRSTRGMMAAALALFSAGCLTKETTHRLVLEPDGGLTWTVFEERVRSDAEAAEDRKTEEREYLELARRDAHPVAAGLAALWPLELHTRIVRDEPPFDVVTSARFGAAEAVFERILDRLRLDGEVTLVRNGDRTRLAVVLDPADSPGEPDDDEPLLALLEEAERYEVLLACGRFVAATGFEIVDDGRRAVPQDDGAPGWSLEWEACE